MTSHPPQEEKRKEITDLNIQLIAIGILQIFILQEEEKNHYHSHCLFWTQWS